MLRLYKLEHRDFRLVKMPRFLAKDYLSEALYEQRLMFLEHYLVPPSHLEQENYVHQGKMDDSAYQHPWTRVKLDHTYFETEKTSDAVCRDFRLLLTNQNVPPHLEPFKVSLDPADVTDVVVLSSNPSSPPPNLEEICKSQSNNRKESMLEEFHKDGVTHTNACAHYLEEVESVNYFSDCLRKMPDVRNMASRLKFKLIQDPFSTTMSEEELLRKDKHYQCTTQLSSCELKETFMKEDLSSYQSYLEETMPADSTACSQPSMNVDLQPFTQSQVEENFDDCANLTEPCNHIPNELEGFADAKDDVQNEAVKCDIAVIEDLALCLDSPLPSALLADGVKCADIENLLQDVKMSPVTMSPVNLLSPASKDSSTHVMELNDKVFCDLESPWLPEPAIHSVLTTSTTLSSEALLKEFGNEEKITKTLESSLSWNPLRKPLTEPSCEMLSPRAADTPCYSIEQFEKVNYSDKTCISEPNFDLKFDEDQWSPETDECLSLSSEMAKPFKHDKLEPVNQTKSQRTIPCVEDSVCMSDPLEVFLMLRKGRLAHQPVKTEDECRGCETIAVASTFPDANSLCEGGKKKSQVERPSSLPEEKINIRSTEDVVATSTREITVQPCPTPGKKKSKSKIIDISITREIQTISNVIERSGQSAVDALSKSGYFSDGQVFLKLSGDTCRFLLKQQEKAMRDNGVNAAAEAVYCQLTLLHCCVNCMDILYHCCLSSVVSHLDIVLDKYSHISTENLTFLKTCMTDFQSVMDSQGLLHPKLTALCKQLIQFMAGKRLKSPEHDIKVLVIVKRDFPSLMKYIESHVTALDGMTAECVTSHINYQSICDRLDRINCLVVYSGHIRSDFPWAQFSLVLDYEHEEQSGWQVMCERQKIRYIALRIIGEASCDVDNVLQSGGFQIKVICSPAIIRNKRLLHLLESRYNIEVCERNYNLLVQSNLTFHADLELDEQTCVIIQEENQLTESSALDGLIARVTALCLKFTLCWIAILSSTPKLAVNLCKLYGVCANFSPKLDDYQVKIVLCSSIEDLAHIVRCAADYAMENCQRLSSGKWLQREYFASNMTVHEKCLLTFPTLNSFTSQLMLEHNTLEALMTMSLQELVDKFPWIPNKVLKGLYNSAHQQTGLNLRTSSREKVIHTPQVPFRESSTRRSPMTCDASQLSNVSNHRDNLPVDNEESDRCPRYHKVPKQSAAEYSVQQYEYLPDVGHDAMSASQDLPYLSQPLTNEFERAMLQNQTEPYLCSSEEEIGAVLKEEHDFDIIGIEDKPRSENNVLHLHNRVLEGCEESRPHREAWPSPFNNQSSTSSRTNHGVDTFNIRMKGYGQENIKYRRVEVDCTNANNQCPTLAKGSDLYIENDRNRLSAWSKLDCDYSRGQSSTATRRLVPGRGGRINSQLYTDHMENDGSRLSGYFTSSQIPASCLANWSNKPRPLSNATVTPPNAKIGFAQRFVRNQTESQVQDYDNHLSPTTDLSPGRSTPAQPEYSLLSLSRRERDQCVPSIKQNVCQEDSLHLFPENKVTLTANSSKRRRLVYELKPGEKGGQTRLAFV